MNKDYSVKISIQLDESSVANIQSQLNNNFKDKKVNISIESKDLEQIKDLLNNIYLELGRMEGKNGFSAATKGAKNLNTELDKTEKKIKNANFATDNWAYNWSKAMQSFLTYNTVTQLFNTVMNGIRDMISQVEELDKSLVELQKVTDLEGESLDKFVEKAYEAGETVAKTGTEMIEAATSFAKAGFKENALELGTVAAMYTNIADEEVNAATAADMIIAQMKAFNIEAKDTMHIIDAINEVSNNFAVSSADISRNLGKASAVMANAGNSMEQYIGLMTAATEVTRNASKAANGLKTLTLRLQGMNDEGEKDLEVQSQMEALFKKLGISVYDANGQLKNTYDILASLAPVYQKLTNAEKAYVTETIAGKYQAQNAAAILSNWSTAVAATETAMNSAGSAAKENEKVLNSIQGHLQRLASAWENFSRTVIDSSLIKFFVDLGTTILKVANNDIVQFIVKVEALSLLLKVLAGTTIGKAISSFIAMAASQGVAATATTVLNGAVVLLNKTFIGHLLVTFAAYLKSVYTVTAANGVLTGSMFALKGVMDVLAAHPLIFAFTAFVGTMALLKAQTQATRDQIDKLNGELTALEEIDSRLEEIQTQFEEENLSVSEQKKLFEEIKDIQKKLRDEYNINTGVLNEQTGSVEKQVKAMRDLVELEERKKNLELLQKTEELGSGLSFGEFVLSPSRWLDGFTKEGQERIQSEVKTYKENIIKYAQGANKEIADAFTDFESAVNDKDITQEKFNEFFTKTFKTIQDSNYSDQVKSILYEKLYSVRDSYQEVLKDIFNENTVKEALKLPQWKNLFDEWANGSGEINDRGFKYRIIGALEKGLDADWFRAQIKKISNSNGFADVDIIKESGIEDALQKEGNWNFLQPLITMSNALQIPLNDLLDILIKIYPQLASVTDLVKIGRESFEALGDELINIGTAYTGVSDALKEYNENGFFTVETLDKLLNDYPQYLDALVDENGKIRDNTAMFKELANAKLDDIQASEDARYYNELLKLAQLDEAGAAQLAAGSINAHDQAMAGQEVNAEKLRNQIQQNINKFNEESAAALNAAYAVVEADHIRNNTIIQKTRVGLTKNLSKALGVSTNKKNTKKSSKTEKEWGETELENLKNQFNNNEITVEKYISSLTTLLGKVKEGSKSWNKIKQELQKQKLDKVKDDYSAGRISLSQYIKELEKLQKEYAKGTKSWNELAEAIKKAKLDEIKKQQNDLKSALAAVNSELDKQIDGYEKSKDKAIEAIEAQIDEQDKLKDSINQNIDDYEAAQKAVLKYLDEQMESLNKNKDNIEKYFDEIRESVENVNKEQEDALALAEAYENYVNAMSNKTKKVYREGIGWVWEADQEAIKSAKKTYEDLLKDSQLKEIEDNKEKTVKSLEEQIETLQNYIDSWNTVLDKYENEHNKKLADVLLGDNWSEAVSQLDPQVVEEFSNAYYNLQQSLSDTEAEIEKLNKQKETEEKYWDDIIEKAKTYKDEWSKVADSYEEAANKQKANQLLAANWEKDILNQRLSVVEDFKNKYNKIMSEIDKVDKMSTDEASGYTPYTLPGYSNGGEVDFTGLAVLHGTPSKPEYVLNNDQMRNLLSNLTKPQYVSNLNGGSSVVNNYNFGNIELPNVNNAQQFINELKSLVNTTKNL